MRLFIFFGFGNLTAQKLKSNSFNPFASNDNKLPNRLKTELTRMESDKNTLDEITKYQSNFFKRNAEVPEIPKLNPNIQQELDLKQVKILINHYNANQNQIKINHTAEALPKSLLDVPLGESINFQEGPNPNN